MVVVLGFLLDSSSSGRILVAMHRFLSPVLVTFLCLSLVRPAEAKVPTLKVGTIIPKGTIYAKTIYKLRSKFKKKVNLIIYPGGRVGNEKQMLGLMRKGRLDVGVFSAIAIGSVVKKTKLLELPYFFKSPAQKQRVVKKLMPDLKKAFAKKGFILAGWAELGKIYLFAKIPIRQLNDLKAAKLWAPKGEQMVRMIYQQWGFCTSLCHGRRPGSKSRSRKNRCLCRPYHGRNRLWLVQTCQLHHEAAPYVL